jgi:predicted dehydrogenase
MAPNEDSCRRSVEMVTRKGLPFAVCHVLRYTAYTRLVKSLIGSDAVGEVVSIQHLEPVGYWHQAHSFVRSNWRNEGESSFMLLQKSCHDLYWIRHIMGRPCRSVSSFGSLMHFKPESKPAEAGKETRCLATRIPVKLYLGSR